MRLFGQRWKWARWNELQNNNNNWNVLFLFFSSECLVTLLSISVYSQWFTNITGFVQVMENLESHGIYYLNFQTWRVMEFKWTVADLREGPGGPGLFRPLLLDEKRRNHRRKKSRQGKQNKTAPPPLFRVRKKEITEVRKASRASKTNPGHPPPPLIPHLDPLAQGLDPSLIFMSWTRV